MEEKFYVVIEVNCWENNVNVNSNVFKSKNKALNFYKNSIKKAKEELESSPELSIQEKEDFICFKSGFYSEGQLIITIQEKEIETI